MGISPSHRKRQSIGFVSNGRRRESSSNPSYGSDETVVQMTTATPKNTIKLKFNRGSNVLIRRSNDAIAKWRLRVTARHNVFNKLYQHGPLAALAAGSMLMWSTSMGSIMFESYSRWKETLIESRLYKALGAHQRGALSRATRPQYERIENAIRSFGQMICLSVEDLYDKKLFKSFSQLKLWAVGIGIRPATQDACLEVLKWLSKLCQAIFLQSEMPKLSGEINLPIENGILLPFDGQLKFISDIYFRERSRSSGLKLEEARALAQIGSYSRAAPYPSDAQIKASVKDTLDIISVEGRKISNRGLKRHIRKLKSYVREITPKDRGKRTHMSLSNSGATESTRSEGGRSGYLTELARASVNKPATVEFLKFISGKIDCFGRRIAYPVTCAIAQQILAREDGDENKFDIQIGDILYVEPAHLPKLLRDKKEGRVVVPPQLGWILANISALDMLKFGWYDNNPSTDYGLLSFDHGQLDKMSIFHMNRETIPVRASLSVEAGHKTRLVTSAPAAITQLGQLVGNKTREYLSNDPFMKVGFNEPDKLWEVLKAYQKRHDRALSGVSNQLLPEL